jgi:hypothetical protein
MNVGLFPMTAGLDALSPAAQILGSPLRWRDALLPTATMEAIEAINWTSVAA